MAFDYVRDGLLLCPTCGISDWDPLSAPDDRFPAVRCRSCGLGVERHVALQPASYTANNYDALRDIGSGPPAARRWHHDTAVAEIRLNQLKEVLPPAYDPADVRQRRWVDVGCGAGAVLAVAARRAFAPTGVEVDPASVEFPALAVAYRAWASGQVQTPTEVVSFFDSLEHILDPTAAIRAAARNLVTGGVLVVEVPDLDVLPPDGFSGWKHRRVTAVFTEHVWHFSTGALEAMVGRYAPGMTPVRSTAPVSGKLQAVWRKP